MIIKLPMFPTALNDEPQQPIVESSVGIRHSNKLEGQSSPLSLTALFLSALHRPPCSLLHVFDTGYWWQPHPPYWVYK